MKFGNKFFVLLLTVSLMMTMGVAVSAADSSEDIYYDWVYSTEAESAESDFSYETSSESEETKDAEDESADGSADTVVTTGGPISITLKTDKSSYEKGDKILVTMTIKNESENTVENLVVDRVIPKGYKINDASSTQLSYPSVAKNKTITEQFELVRDGATPIVQSVTKYGTVAIVAILAVDLVALVIFGIVKLIKKPKRAMSIVLAVIITFGTVPAFAAISADEIYTDRSDSVSIGIKVGDDEIVLGADLSYSAARSSSVLSNFRADQLCFWTNTTSKISFYVDSVSEYESVELHSRQGGFICDMYDNGINGDEAANDGIYSCVKTISSSAMGSSEYYALADDGISGCETVFFFDPIEQADVDEMKDTVATISGLDAQFKDDKGYVPESNISSALQAVKNYADELNNDGKLLDYSNDGFSSTITLNNGMTISYVPKTEALDAGGSDVEMTVLTMQPYYDLYTDLGDMLTAPDTAAKDISSVFDNISFSDETNYDTSAVTLELIKSLSSNQIVLWHGHGGYSDSVRSYLCLGQEFQWRDPSVNRDYYLDYINGRIMCGSSGNTIITSKFIDTYCGDLSGSFFYLGTCSSGKDDTFANALLNKGAVAVVGNNATISSKYNTRMLFSVATLMTQLNLTTGNFYTLDEALRGSFELFGEDDLAWCAENGIAIEKAVAAYPVIFGGEAANNYRFFNNGTCNASGRVMADHQSAIDGATVSVYKGDTLMTSATTGSDGVFNFNLPVDDYRFVVTADGFKELTAVISLDFEGVAYIEDLVLVNDSEDVYGFASGTITNAFTGFGEKGVSLFVREGWGNTDGEVFSTTTTSSSGSYSLELPMGNYTVTASKSGFITASFNIYVSVGSIEDQNCAISPETIGGNFRVVLTWDDDPHDVDSMVLALGESEYFLYFDDTLIYENGAIIASLDVDDTSGYGPETITLSTNSNSDYFYIVRKYDGYEYLSQSNAKVTLYQDGRMLGTFNVPTDQGTGDYWNVFAITGGKIVACNTVTDEPDVMYIYE